MARAKPVPAPSAPTARDLAVADLVRRAGGESPSDACRRWGVPDVEALARTIGGWPLPDTDAPSEP